VLRKVFYFFYLLEHEDHFSLTLAYLKRVRCVLLVKLDQGLLELKDFLVGQMNLCHHVLFLFFVSESLLTLAIGNCNLAVYIEAYLLILHGNGRVLGRG